MVISVYELAILGNATPDQRAALEATLGDMISDFGLEIGVDVVVRDASSTASRDPRAACVATYFGGASIEDAAIADALLQQSVPVIPAIGAADDFGAAIPRALQASNGLVLRADDAGLVDLALSMLECVGLLRRQRRAFVSYRRTESRAAAAQLHDLLSARGFDVFLDTHGIRPGDPFQDVLWHRLCDADVVLMLDTPTYFDKKWTRMELGRARAKEIHVLRIVWPGHRPTRAIDLAETIQLEADELEEATGPITATRADAIVHAAERLRSRSIASRYMSITGKLRADIGKIGASIEGIGAHRAIAVRLPDDRRIWAFPVVGIPTAELLNDISDKAKSARHGEMPFLVYDEVGIRNAWTSHLRWLDDNISIVRAIKVHAAGWTLAGLED